MPKQTIHPDAYQQLVDTRDHHLREAQRIDDAIAVFRDVMKLASKATILTGKARERATGIRAPQGISCAAFVRQHGNPRAISLGDEATRVMALATEQGLTFARATIYQSLLVSSKRPSLPATSAAPLPLLDAPPAGEMTTRAFALQHGNLDAPTYREGRRLEALAAAQGLTLGAKAFENVLRRIKKEQKAGHKAAPPKVTREERLKAARDRAEAQKNGTSPTDYVREVIRAAGKPLTRDEIVEQAKLRERTRNPKFVNVSATKILEAMQRSKEIKKTSAGFVAFKLKADDVGSNGAHP